MAEKLIMKDDIMFKTFFDRNQNYLKSFLSALLGEGIKIKKVIRDAKLEHLARETKYGVLDLDIELENGEIINIEMQLRNNHNIEKRTSFYASKKVVEQLEPKEDFNKLNRVIIIAILDYALTDLPEYVTETVRVARNYKEYELNNLVKYYYIELDKFRKQEPDMSDKLNQWLAFIDMERGDLLEMAKKQNKEIKKAVEKYEVLTGDEEVKRITELRLMSKMEEKAALATARSIGAEKGMKIGTEKGMKIGTEKGMKIGTEKGMKIGKEEEKKRIAKELLKEGMAIEKIIQITGVSEDDLNKL